MNNGKQKRKSRLRRRYVILTRDVTLTKHGYERKIFACPSGLVAVSLICDSRISLGYCDKEGPVTDASG